MSRRTRFLLLAGLVICVASASLAAIHRERVSFVGMCWRNGNELSECTCTFNALGDLPDNYRGLAISWAHDTRTGYAANVMYLIAAEGQRIGASRIKGIWDTRDAKKTIQAWVWQVGKGIGWVALQKAAPTVAANLAPVGAVLPVLYDAGAEFAKARSVLHRHCARGQTFIVQINETREEAERIAAKLAAGTIDVVVDAASTTTSASARTAERFWIWLKSWVWE